jgi:hypothetical protein
MDEPKVEIGLREIYDAVVELKGIVSGHPDKLDDHEERIRKLEMKIWGISGFVGIVSFLAARFIP